jgi:protein tyrosine phosphatase
MLNNSDIAKLNTVMVDGFRSPQKFTVTQQPTRTTLEAYWKLMQTANASAVILLHNTVSCSFWPDEDHPEVYPSESMTLHHQDTQSLDCGDLIKIKMMSESEANRTIDILLMKTWRIDSHRPESVPDFVKFCLKSEEILKRSSRVVVTC